MCPHSVAKFRTRRRPIDFKNVSTTKPLQNGRLPHSSATDECPPAKLQTRSPRPGEEQFRDNPRESEERNSATRSDILFRNICVIGGGAWGTALAITANRAGANVTLWVREAPVARKVRESRINPYLPEFPLPEAISVTSEIEDALDGADLVMLVVPSQYLRSTCRMVESSLSPGAPVVICSKGVEAGSGKLMTRVVSDEMPGRPQAVLSGPSFAKEVAAGQPTAVTVAVDCAVPEELIVPGNLATRIALSLGTRVFRPYVSDDPIGVEVGGAVKNVIAIACGMAAGRGMGSNPRAALITRGLAEIKRLAMALGGRAETVTGLAGIGDLALTCSDEQSRNFSFGKMLAQGKHRHFEADEPAPVVEGAVNADSVVTLANKLNVEMPICEMVDAVVNHGVGLDAAMEDLMTRPIRAEVRAVETLVRVLHPAIQEPEEEWVAV